MGKRHIITITGDLASGKGTVSKLLKRDLGYTIYRNGEYVRELAKEKKMSIYEFQEYLNANPHIDRQIEQSARQYADTHDKIIVDARLGWYAIPESFKVYMKVDLKEGAKRAFYDERRRETESFENLEQAQEYIKMRYEEENKRWFEEYGIRRDDMSNYDLVIDTTNANPEDINKKIKQKYFEWLNKEEN